MKPIQVYIENIYRGDSSGFTLHLPISFSNLQPFLSEAEITGWWDMKVWEALSPIDGLGSAVTKNLKKTIRHDTLDELNYLAVRIQYLSESERKRFSEVLQTERDFGSINEIINLTYAENLSLVYGDGYSTWYNSSEDIPDENKIWMRQKKESRALVKLETMAIDTLLLKLQEMDGSGMFCAEDSLKLLKKEETTEYLLYASRYGVRFFKAEEAYKQDFFASGMLPQALQYIKNWKDIRIFSVHLAEHPKNSSYKITGDLIELDKHALFSNILHHLAVPDRMDRVKLDGAVESYDLPLQADLSAEQQEWIKCCSAHFPKTSLKKAEIHFLSLTEALKEICIPISIDAFLA